MKHDRRSTPFDDAGDSLPATSGRSASESASEPASASDARDARFLLRGPDGLREGTGCRRMLVPGTTATLASRVEDFFAAIATDDDPAPVLVGALPFDPSQHDHLYQPLGFSRREAGAREAAMREMGNPVASPGARAPAWLDSDGLHARQHPTVADYAHAVAECVARLRSVGAGGRMPASGPATWRGGSGPLRKVVLARSLHVDAGCRIDPVALAARLDLDPAVTTFIASLPVARDEPPAWLVGATPELLVSRRGAAVLSHPLAGSARRERDARADRRSADALLVSDKDHGEHRFVVEAILDHLAPLCAQLQAPAQPSLHATATMWHLGTRITGVLKDPDISAAALAAILHPTPAVCGTPSLPALRTIRELEPEGRGFYAGAVGWTDAHGDGDWHVAIRCARVQGNAMRLFAGAGIVADSVPALEVEETAAKFMAMLNAMGISDNSVL